MTIIADIPPPPPPGLHALEHGTHLPILWAISAVAFVGLWLLMRRRAKPTAHSSDAKAHNET